MKAKLLVVAIIGAVTLWLWYADTVKTQKTILQESGEGLWLAQQAIYSGNLEAANSLLMLVVIKLAVLDKFYTLPSINRQRLDLLDDLYLKGIKTDLKKYHEELIRKFSSPTQER